MNKSRLLGAICAAIFGLITLSSHAAFVSRLGGQAYYNDILKITLLTDTNYAATDTLSVPGINPTTGLMTWDTANLWIAALNADGGTGYLGINNWRLPSVDVNGDDSVVTCNGSNATACQDNEMGYLVWEEGISNFTPSPFTNIDSPFVYWSNTTFAANTAQAWWYNFNNAGASPILKNDGFSPAFAWAVVDGDVSAVPVPAAVWLFGSGLIGLLGLARRNR